MYQYPTDSELETVLCYSAASEVKRNKITFVDASHRYT